MTEVRRIAVMGATGRAANHSSTLLIADANLGRQGRGVIDALLFTKGSIEYTVRPMTRSLKSKLAQRFAFDYPQLSLVQ